MFANWPTTGGFFFLLLILGYIVFCLFMAGIGYAAQLYLDWYSWRLRERYEKVLEERRRGAERANRAGQDP